MPAFIDITGKKYNRLTVIGYAGDSKWECRCDCGNTTIVDGTKLRKGNTKSCGCLRREAKGIDLQYNIIGNRYGRLLVIRHDGSGVWTCKCDCGNITHVKGNKLRSGHTRSCGCLLDERRAESHTKHNGSDDRLYGVHQNIKSRCYNKNHISYKYYGAKGVKVCDEWHDYATFREWAIKNGYDPNARRGECTIDRIDPNGDYEPSNCRWVDSTVQSRNRSCLNLVEQLDELGNVINIYESGSEAGEATGLNPANICAACRRNGNHAGFGWRYVKKNCGVPAQEVQEGQVDG